MGHGFGCGEGRSVDWYQRHVRISPALSYSCPVYGAADAATGALNLLKSQKSFDVVADAEAADCGSAAACHFMIVLLLSGAVTSTYWYSMWL